MACSKVFSGKLPEITDDIVQYFRNDYKTLHSCVLVNRAWCRITIPLLWKEPFSIPVKNYHFIEIYLHNLNEYDKTKLNVCGINNKIFPSKTLFNYPSFIQRINTFKIEQSIEKWITSIGVLKDMTTIVKTLIYKLLFKIFINNEVNLRTFEILITTDQDHRNFNEIFELILQKPNFICNIRNFKLQRITNVRKILQFLEFISLKCNSISSINFQFQKFNDENNLLVKKFLSIFEQLNNLESIHIIYCRLLNYEIIQQIINLTKPFKLKSLFMDEILQIDSLELLLQKSGDYLENFGFGSFSNDSYIRNELINELKQQLIDLIIKYCTKIELFDLFECNINNIYPKIFNLIQNIDQNLYYLSIDFDDDDEILSTNLLLNLGQILPLKLEYLNLSFIIQNINDFEIFLKNSHNTFIKKLLIRNKISKRKIKDILPYIKKYIMKEKRVEYLAIKDSYLEYDLREVKDFRLYNIELRNYDNLYIQAVNYVKEMY
ncbi:hypothetical protein C1646_812161 [Rhizophagus diaphanus]|nr:hypothetical protein C1646_812161 [Rhizophagus diaphanus] [Rhizophagus sp. MUCL 43196]